MKSKPILLLTGFFLFFLLVIWYLKFSKEAAILRPTYIMINETDDHGHDLAFKMSLKIAEKKSGIENALIILKKLPTGKTIDEVAVAEFQRLRIGQDRGGKGLLLLYSEFENLLKLEVSYELEGVFPDVYCHQIEEAARTYMLSEIPQDFISELLITLNLRATEPRHRDEIEFSRPTWLSAAYLSGGGGARSGNYENTLIDYLNSIRQLPTSELEQYKPNENLTITVEKYLQSLSRGIGNPNLGLLTEGSQIYRMIVPRNSAQQKRVFDFYQRSNPYQIIEAGKIALIVFKKGVPNLPIVARLSSDGLWYVDEPKSWTYFHRFEDGVDFIPKFADLPFIEGLGRIGYSQKSIYKNWMKTPLPMDLPYSVVERENQLRLKAEKSQDQFQANIDLGDFYLFELNSQNQALRAFEKALSLKPESLYVRWRLYDLYMQLSLPEKMIQQLGYLSEHQSGDSEAKDWYKFYKEQYDLVLQESRW